MPRGRFVSKCISVSEQVNELIERCGFEGGLFFTWLITHLDGEGRISGKASTLKGVVVPLANVSTKRVEQILVEAEKLGLVRRYKVGETECLELPRFHEHQKGLRRDREAPSKVPPSTYSGVTPELLQSNSGPTPATTACDPLNLNLNLNLTSLDLNTKNSLILRSSSPDMPKPLPRLDTDEQVQEIFQYYRKYHPKTSASRLQVMSDEYRCISSMLESGFSVSECCKAIDGYHASRFHNGDNENKQKYLGLDLIFRDTSHVFKGVSMADDPISSVSCSEKEARSLTAAKRWIERQGGSNEP